MKVGSFKMLLGYAAVGGLIAASAAIPTGVVAQENQAVAAAAHPGPADSNHTSEFLRKVRESSERFRDVEIADGAGYKFMFGCVSGDDTGAMGMHFVNMDLVMDPALDITRPEIVIYEPLPNGRLQLVGVDYLVFKDAWHTANPTAGAPTLGGQALHLFPSPNRFGLPDFYTLHVWAWKDNPTGMFVNWHSQVSCESFSGRNP